MRLFKEIKHETVKVSFHTKAIINLYCFDLHDCELTYSIPIPHVFQI